LESLCGSGSDMSNFAKPDYINSREAMPNGGTIQIKAENVKSASGKYAVTMSVTDQGGGISEDFAKRIFSSYFTTKFGGTDSGWLFVNQS